MRIYNTVKQVAKFLTLSVFLQIFATSAWAQSQSQSQSDVADESLPASLASFCPADIDDAAYEAADTNEKVNIKACQWLRDTEPGRAANARNNNEGDGLYFGVATSQFKPHSERGTWAATRPLTYQAAYFNLAAEFALQEYGQDLDSAAKQKQFKQRGLDPQDLKCYPNENESKWHDRVLRKAGAVLEKKLDKALVEMNVDPSSFGEDSKQRKLARRVGEFVSSLERATGREVKPSKVSGLVIINTFEVVDGEGDGSSASIGILARWSNDVYEMTRLMAKHKGNLPKDYPPGKSGKKVNQWINDIKRDLSHNFGVRIMRDEKGYPLLLAFGHSARRYFGPDLERRRDDKQFALEMSGEEAYGQLTDYVAATLAFARVTSKNLDTSKGYELFDENGQCIKDEVRKRQFKERIESTWHSRASLDNFKGARIKYKGMIKHSVVEGVDIAVSVVAWSPEISTKPSTVRKKPIAVKKASGALSGTALGDMSDF